MGFHAKTDYKSTDDYIAAQPEAVRALLGGVCATIHLPLSKPVPRKLIMAIAKIRTARATAEVKKRVANRRATKKG